METTYRHRYPIEVRFRDIDSMGHVNNAVFCTYLEESRVQYVRELFDSNPGLERTGMVVASLKVDYKRPVHLGDRVEVRIAVTYLGTRSFGFRYEVWSEREQATVLLGESVQVAYDYRARSSVEIPAALREAVERFEARSIPAKG